MPTCTGGLPVARTATIWRKGVFRRLRTSQGPEGRLKVDHLLRYSTAKLVSSLQFFGWLHRPEPPLEGFGGRKAVNQTDQTCKT
jgi:hypothetical protein